MVRNLHQLPELRDSQFGRPPLRHGLNLLWWFAKNCVRVDSNRQMTALCDPTNGTFGFHRFFNRERLLPRTHLKYYEVGNLHSCYPLPDYVTEDYTGEIDDSNSDRIIVCYDSNRKKFESVYVTRHSNQKKFDQNHTYCITTDLLKLVIGMEREDFLREILNESNNDYKIYYDNPSSTIINMPPRVIRPIAPVQSRSSNRSNSSCENWCIGVSCAIGLLIIAAVTFLVLKYK